MIFVTQGHERGIGFEVFLKSYFLLPTNQRQKITLCCSRSSLEKNLDDLNISSSTLRNLKILNPSKKHEQLTPSLGSLLTALEIIEHNDILITLPTSKDQLLYNGIYYKGYTEFFRAYYQNPNLVMAFRGPKQNIILITDHIPLKDVSDSITLNIILEKIKLTLSDYQKYFFHVEEIIFSGINPHSGEGGLLGKEDSAINNAILDLNKLYSAKFHGPYSGDTLHTLEDTGDESKQLIVYMYHDQGLAPFKARHGLIGANITIGLPFLRMSVDHGTAFHLYGQNKANIAGMMFLFRQAFGVITNEYK